MALSFIDRKTFRELIHLAFPMVVSQGSWALMMFADRYFMSMIDSAHIAASLGGGVSFFVTMSLFMGLISYGNALVAQYYGRGEYQKCPLVVSQAVLVALASQPFLALLAWYIKDSFAWMGHAPAQVALEQRYYLVLMATSFFYLTKLGLASYYAGIGRTRVVMVADLVGVLANIPISYLLIFGKLGFPAMGITGAALGTGISNLVTIGVLLWFYFERVHRDRFLVLSSFRINRGILRRYLRLGFPSGFETFMGAATFNLFLLMFQAYGVAEGAAMAIVFNWDMTSFVPITGLGIAVTTLIGRFVGAGNMDRAGQVIRSAFVIGLSYSGLLAICFICFRYQLMDVFHTGETGYAEVRRLGALMMIGMASYVMVDACILVTVGVLRGAGDTRWFMIASVTLHILMVVVQYFIIMVYRLESLTSWWAFVASLMVIAVTYLWRLRSGTWRRADRLERVMAEQPAG